MTRRLGSIVLIALVFLSTGIRAQESASSGIVGQVLDATKGAMPGATVTVINTATNAQRVVATDGEGRFSVPNLPPATYTIRVELSGFETTELKGVILRNGEVGRPTITLGLANVAENVTVVGLSPLLQTTNASVSQTITQKQIEDLPVAGRSLLSFASLSAGVTPQAFGLAAGLPHRRVVSLDTDGGMMFNLGILATLANEQPKNLLVVVWDNECYQSIGGPPTHTSGRVNIARIANGAGIIDAHQADTLDDFERHCAAGLKAQSPYVIVAKVSRESRRDIRRKHSDGREDKYIFVRHVEKTEGIVIMGPSEHN